jgi:hypothetical protein
MRKVPSISGYHMHSRDIFGDRYEIANRKILKEINLGRIAGSFPEPHFPTLRVSPIFVIPKKSSTEFRLIHNLSFPPNNSVVACAHRTWRRLNDGKTPVLEQLFDRQN